MKRGAGVLAAFLLTPCAAAHTAVTSTVPASQATITAPRNVEIAFNEAVDLHFATFKVYPLKAQGDKLALNRAAATLAKSALKARNDQAQRADQFTPQYGTTAKVSVPLKSGLAKGPYVFMWRVLSGDGHIVTGQSVFTIR